MTDNDCSPLAEMIPGVFHSPSSQAETEKNGHSDGVGDRGRHTEVRRTPTPERLLTSVAPGPNTLVLCGRRRWSLCLYSTPGSMGTDRSPLLPLRSALLSTGRWISARPRFRPPGPRNVQITNKSTSWNLGCNVKVWKQESDRE